MKNFTINFVALFVIIFAVLFDTDGMQLGMDIWPSIPVALVTIAGIIGNVLWILGVGQIFASIILMTITPQTFEKEAHKYFTKHGNFDKIVNISTYRNTLLFGNGICALFSIGSGFWFFGSCWLIFVLTLNKYQNDLRKIAIALQNKRKLQ